MPRAALLSFHARVEGAGPSVWADPALVQVWGPRYHVYVVAARDLAVFTLGRLPDGGEIRRRALDLAARLEVFLGGAELRYDEAGRALGVHGNNLRYAALTGRLAIRWEGARRPTVWIVPPPAIDPAEATRELARRYLHVFGPTGPAAFGKWGAIGVRKAVRTFEELESELVPVLTPSGEAWMLARDEATIREPPSPAAGPGSCRAATPTPWASRARIVRSWYRMPANVASCGHRVCGPARCSSQGISSGPGAAPSVR